MTTLVSGENTRGTIAIIELREVPGQEPPLHLHDNEDETIYLCEGELSVIVGNRVLRVRAGACVFLPRGIEHGYVVESGEALLLVALTPAGLGGFLAVLDMGVAGADVERLIAVAARCGVTITGPAAVKA